MTEKEAATLKDLLKRRGDVYEATPQAVHRPEFMESAH